MCIFGAYDWRCFFKSEVTVFYKDKRILKYIFICACHSYMSSFFLIFSLRYRKMYMKNMDFLVQLSVATKQIARRLASMNVVNRILCLRVDITRNIGHAHTHSDRCVDGWHVRIISICVRPSRLWRLFLIINVCDMSCALSVCCVVGIVVGFVCLVEAHLVVVCIAFRVSRVSQHIPQCGWICLNIYMYM